ncbi:MAG: NADH-quinone oxidoreductase subunit J [Bacteroidales bacterium]|jgi:NADH-quinone oxidoreductase subunit J|nr:NADH-quinone oxidoreductase subunit J [Bacteroidales bacterium]
MDISVSQVIFGILAAVIVVFSVLAVSSRRVLHSATSLLFVLLATAGIYFMLDYHFLAAVQITVYAGGILVLFVFSIFLTSQAGTKMSAAPLLKRIAGFVAAFAGAAVCLVIILKNSLKVAETFSANEMDMAKIGMDLMGTGKFQYLLPFEAISILLLACIIGGILIARKR